MIRKLCVISKHYPSREDPIYAFVGTLIEAIASQGVECHVISPVNGFEGMQAAWAFVSEDQRDVMLCVYQALSAPNSSPLRVRLAGLDPSLSYRNEEDGIVFHGTALMNAGLSVRLSGDFSSKVFRFSAV